MVAVVNLGEGMLMMPKVSAVQGASHPEEVRAPQGGASLYHGKRNNSSNTLIKTAHQYLNLTSPLENNHHYYHLLDLLNLANRENRLQVASLPRAPVQHVRTRVHGRINPPDQKAVQRIKVVAVMGMELAVDRKLALSNVLFVRVEHSVLQK